MRRYCDAGLEALQSVQFENISFTGGDLTLKFPPLDVIHHVERSQDFPPAHRALPFQRSPPARQNARPPAG